LPIEGLDPFEGRSIHYWASPIEARLCSAQDVALVGGGNSAGQAAVYLSGQARSVTLIARRPLAATMSSYLVERIESIANIKVVTPAQVVGVEGSESGAMEAIRWCHGDGGDEHRLAVSHLFLFIGADPNTDWLKGTGLALDHNGFIRTGPEAAEGRLPLETSRRGIFAIGDIRSGSVKRVAAAAGDGAQVVAALHARFADWDRLGAPAAEAEPAQIVSVTSG